MMDEIILTTKRTMINKESLISNEQKESVTTEYAEHTEFISGRD